MAILHIEETGMVKLVDYMNNINEKLPGAINRNMWNVAQMVGGELRFSMARTKPKPIEDFDGTLRAGTFPKRGSGKNEWVFLMPRHARYLDSMGPHFVNVYSNPPLARWMQVRGYHPRADGTILVRPRRFIRRTFERLDKRLSGDLRKGQILKTIRGET